MTWSAAFLLVLLATPAADPAAPIEVPDQEDVDPGAPGAAAFERGLAAYRGQDWEAAIAPLTEAARAGYGASQPFLLLRDAYERAYGVEGSVDRLEEAVRADPDDAVARNNLACFYMRQRRWKDAQQYLLSALKLDPEAVDARFNLAFLQAQLGQNNGAFEHYEAILSAYPEHVRALSEMCFLLSEREGRPSEAEEYCERAADAAPHDPQLRMNLGLVRMRGGDLEGAEEALEPLTAAESLALAHSARTYLGYVSLQRQQYDAARSQFEQVVAEADEPESGEALVGLARVHQARKNYPKAAEYYRSAYRITGSGMLLGALVKVYLQRFFYAIVFALMALMAALLWRYLRVKPLPQPST